MSIHSTSIQTMSLNMSSSIFKIVILQADTHEIKAQVSILLFSLYVFITENIYTFQHMVSHFSQMCKHS
jgi:hypothetical protein